MPKPHACRLLRDTRGANFAEYLIIVACVAILALVGWRAFAKTAEDKLTNNANCIASMSGGCVNPGSGTGPGGTTAPGTSPELQTGAQQIKQQEPKSKGFWERALDVGKGFVVDGLWGTVTGVVEIVTHPVETAKGLWQAVTHPVDTFNAIKDGVVNAWNENPERLIGAGIFEIVTLPIAALKVTKATKVTKVIKAIDKIDDVTPDEAAKALALAKKAEDAAAARKWADELANSAKADPAQIAEEAAKFTARRNEIKKAYDMVMRGEAEPPPGVTRERLKLAVEGGPDGQRIPLNFKDRAQFDRFQSELNDIFKSEGIDDATVSQVGSATQGWKGNPKKASPFNPDGTLNPEAYWSPKSDLDFAVFSDQALAQARAAGATVNDKVVVGGKYTVIKNSSGMQNTSLGQKLDAFAQKWNQEFYGDAARQPGFEGIDFKINLSNQPFSTAPTIIKP